MNDYGAILNRLNTEISAFKTDIPENANSASSNIFIDPTFLTKYIYYIAGVGIILLIVVLVTTKPFFIMKEEQTIDENNIKYKTKKMCLRKLGISIVTVCILFTILYFVYKWKITSN
jgi:hypothetical protein